MLLVLLVLLVLAAPLEGFGRVFHTTCCCCCSCPRHTTLTSPCYLFAYHSATADKLPKQFIRSRRSAPPRDRLPPNWGTGQSAPPLAMPVRWEMDLSVLLEAR